MKRLLALLCAGAAAVLLTACDPTDEQRARAHNALPAGCRLIDIGSYGDIKSLVVVNCDGARTTSSNFSWTQPAGKTVTTVQGAALVIGEPS